MRRGKHSFEDYGPAFEIEADVAILGAGAGGCAAACVLAEAGLKVAVFEEGRHWKNTDFKSSNPWAFKNLYQDRGTRIALGNGWLPVNGGKGVGGSTLINSAISFKTPEPIVRDWRERVGFDPQGTFLGHVDHVWDTIGVAKNPPQVQGNNNHVFLRGAKALGWEADFLDRSAPGCTGCGVCQLGCPSGGKNSVDKTYLALALRHDVGVYADCRATGVEREGRRVTAIHGHSLDPDTQEPVGRWSVRAKRFLISGGPIGSPRFLMANDLAPNAHCGLHLHLHPASAVYALFHERIEHWRGVSQGTYVDRWDEGYLLQTATVTPDNNFLGLTAQLGPEANAFMAQLQHMAIAGAIIHDEDTVGRVTQDGIFFEFGDHDRQILLKGLRACAELYFAAGAHTVLPSVVGAGLLTSPDQIEQAIPLDTPFTKMIAVASHPMGTCRMGDDPEESVVDPRGQVWGWDNLFVADASTFPTSLGVNPQVTVMAMGRMVAENIAEG
jgi:choline dehydrogenase-like flavoprotein